LTAKLPLFRKKKLILQKIRFVRHIISDLADGYDLWDVLQAASVNAQKHYNQNWGLLQAGDPATFITVDRITPNFRVEMTVIRGEEVFNYNASLPSRHDLDDHILDFDFPNNFVPARHSRHQDYRPPPHGYPIHAAALRAQGGQAPLRS
jgi:adenine deaminase